MFVRFSTVFYGLLIVFCTNFAEAAPSQENLLATQMIEANDAGEKVFAPVTGSQNFLTFGSYFGFRKSFQEISKVLTTEVERSFDVFVFANVSFEKYGSPNDFIPSQRLRIYRKRRSSDLIFNRTITGRIQSHNPVAANALGISDHQPALPGFPAEIPISSGASHLGRGYVDTFSGIFRLNHNKSRTHRHQSGMIHSMYVDIVYPSGKVSGIAIHGTPKQNYKDLGRQASHGCIRVKQSISLPLYEYVMGESLFDPNLLDFGRTERFPQSPLLAPRAGQRVLMIYFYGYDGNQGLD